MDLRVAAAAGLAAVALVAVAVVWLEDEPELSAAEAVTATEAALAHAGLDAEVASDPLRTTYTSRASETVDVWEVHATVRAEPIALSLTTSEAHPVAIDDRNADRSSYVLSDAEYEAVARSVEDPARSRAIQRNIWFTVAAALVVALAIVHAARAAQLKEARP